MNHCLSCHKSIPDNQWLCEECFSYIEETEGEEGENEDIISTKENLLRRHF